MKCPFVSNQYLKWATWMLITAIVADKLWTGKTKKRRISMSEKMDFRCFSANYYFDLGEATAKMTFEGLTNTETFTVEKDDAIYEYFKNQIIEQLELTADEASKIRRMSKEEYEVANE